MPYCKACHKEQALHRYYTKVRGTTPQKKNPKPCEECGEKFTPLRSTAIYCSTRCGSRGNRRKSRWNPTPMECLNCGTEFVPQRRASVTCSRDCYMQAVYITRGYGIESRARFYGVEYQRIENRDVFERDNWVCGICSQPIDPSVKRPDMMSASLDHIIPISKGGPHTPDNVQAAHLRCNVRKSATMPTLTAST